MVDISSVTSLLRAAFPVITSSAVSAFIALLVYNVIVKQIKRLKNQDILDANTAFLLQRGIQWLFYIICAVILFNLLGVQIDFFVGLWVLAGGTVIGFASMNTIGNAIAGLLIMLSRPFKINDRLYFQEKYVVVEEIDLIYTRMRTLDNVIISVPNQTLIESVIENQSIYDKIRRRIVLTIDYKDSPEKINNLFMESIGKVEEILEDPKPYVWITDFGNNAMEYTLFYHIASKEKFLQVDAKVKTAIVDVFTANGIDLSTPTLIHSV